MYQTGLCRVNIHKPEVGKFLGKVFTHFSKPRKKSLADMHYGIQASGDTRIPEEQPSRRRRWPSASRYYDVFEFIHGEGTAVKLGIAKIDPSELIHGTGHARIGQVKMQLRQTKCASFRISRIHSAEDCI